VVPMLNYLFFYEGIASLDAMTVDMVKRYLNAYGRCELPWDDEMTSRSEQTVRRCIAYIMDFLVLFIEDRQGHCRIRKSDLYRSVDGRDRHGRLIKGMKKVPVFEVYYLDSHKSILRDVPNAAFDIMFSHIMRYHPELLGLVMLSAFAGLRPSEACNVRREDSPLGPGIIFTKMGGKVVDISIDLLEEFNLRSDVLPVGGIKKHRTQQINPIFTKIFLQSYELYTSWLNTQPCDEEYKPFSVNTRGNAMTYDLYYLRFTSMVKNELVPIFLKDDNPEVVLFGHLLTEHNLGPHCFRHWFTVQLVLSGITDPGTIQHWRGDRNPESAILYLNNKGELEKMYRRINEETYDYLYWLSEKRHMND
ncbi:MAG: site-specific integrase, partial [Mogibacterium sp.]|nr:site-specific integrase [Mogibacterium sp.]